MITAKKKLATKIKLPKGRNFVEFTEEVAPDDHLLDKKEYALDNKSETVNDNKSERSNLPKAKGKSKVPPLIELTEPKPYNDDRTGNIFKFIYPYNIF